MKVKPVWKTAELYEPTGVLKAYVRVPAEGKPPGIIQWGNKYFARAVDDLRYVQTSFYFVPIEHMHSGPAETAKPSAEKLKP